jgi:xylulokinase
VKFLKGSSVISIDLGTMGVKVAIFDCEGRLLADAYRELPLHYPKLGWVEQDPEDFYRLTVDGVRETVHKARLNPHDVMGISLGGQMAGLLMIDEKWNALTKFDSWLDTRCDKYAKRIKQDFNDLVWEITGMPPHTHSTCAKLLWWKNENPILFDKACKFLWASDYVAGRMAGLRGEDAFVNYTFIAFSGLQDARRLQWSSKLLDLFGIPLEKLPKIVEPWKVVGELTSEAAKDCGLRRGIPIVAGAGDQTAGSLGAGIVEPGMIFDAAGTASVFAACTDRFEPDRRHETLECLKSVIPNLWLSLAAVSGGGLCLRWFRDNIAAEERIEATRRGVSAYSILDSAAAHVPIGSGGLLFIPHFAGRRDPWEKDVRGLWIGLNWGCTRAHLYRAILESIAYEYYFYLETLKDLLPEFEATEVRVIGGGAKSDLWNQIKADVLNVPYAQLNREETTVLGLAVVAGYGVGAFTDMKKTVNDWVKITNRVVPRAGEHNIYRRFAEVYSSLFATLRETYSSLAKLREDMPYEVYQEGHHSLGEGIQGRSPD